MQTFLSVFAYSKHVEVPVDHSILHPKEILASKEFSAIRMQTYLSGRYCAKSAIRKLTNVKRLSDIFIDHGVFDFPVIMDPHLPNTNISIAHTNNAAVAITFSDKHPVGLDIEDICSQRSVTIETQLTCKEKRLNDSLAISNVLFNTLLWTSKESLGKVLKIGLMASPLIYEIVSINAHLEGFYVLEFKYFFQYKTISFVYQDSVITFCIPKKSEFTPSSFFC